MWRLHETYQTVSTDLQGIQFIQHIVCKGMKGASEVYSTASSRSIDPSLAYTICHNGSIETYFI